MASLSPSGTEVLLRSVDAPAALWNSLGRNIAPGQAHTEIDGSLRVPIGRFLASRNWLGQALTTHACAVDIAPALAALLERGNAERSEIDSLLGAAPASLSPASLVSDLAAAGFKRDLKPFQLRDLGHLLALSHGANFSVPGAGKTTVAYALHALERARGRVDRLLVVAPLSAFAAWADEVQECFDEPLRVARLTERGALSADVVLVNYQRLAASYDQIISWVVDSSTHVILDEAHRMKRGKAGEWGRACLDLAHLATRRDILTGTPAPQHPNDFVALVDFVWPNQSNRILPDSARRSDPPPAAMREVSARLAPLFTRTTKAELELEPPDRRAELVTMKPLQAEIYEALRTKMRHATNVRPRERAQWGQMGEVVMYLLEAASNPALLARAVTGADGVALQWPSLAILRTPTSARRSCTSDSTRSPRSSRSSSRWWRPTRPMAARPSCGRTSSARSRLWRTSSLRHTNRLSFTERCPPSPRTWTTRRGKVNSGASATTRTASYSWPTPQRCPRE
ncbi:MAG: SNF2-related protein [Acidimicrobiia bacterium]|nr:SNF2-related protein [Acidimicrobiia bacterium]